MYRVADRKLHNRQNAGMTLIEMVVSFMLLSLFVSAAAVVIFNVTNLYYHVRSENYARQVADVVMNKVTTEISGAKYSPGFAKNNPTIYASSSKVQELTGETCSGSAIALFDRTDTNVLIYAHDGILRIYYYEINDTVTPENNRQETFWNYDRSVYNNYRIESMDFAQANSDRNAVLAEAYEVASVNPDDYDGNVIAVYIKMVSPKYGPFTICRYVRIYNADEKCTVTLEQ